jgi:hypothetical protein
MKSHNDMAVTMSLLCCFAATDPTKRHGSGWDGMKSGNLRAAQELESGCNLARQRLPFISEE